MAVLPFSFNRRRRPKVSGPSVAVSPHSYHPTPVRQPDRGLAIVTADQMTTCPALHRAMTALSGFVAGLDLIDLDTNERISQDPDSGTFYGRPTTSGLTWFEFIDALMTDRLMHGNSFGIWTGVDAMTGMPNRCEIVHQNYVTPLEHRSETFMPIYSINGEHLSYPDVIHWRGWMRGGYSWGISPLKVLASMIAVQLSEQAYARNSYEDGARIPGYLSTPEQLDPDVLAEYAKPFAEAMGGRGTGVSALGGGMEWKTMMLNEADRSLLASRNFSQTEACMVMGVPPHLVGAPAPENSSMSYSNLHMDLRAFRSMSLNRHIRSLEQTFALHGFRFRFDLDEAVRPPKKERWETYEIMLRTGAVTVEQVCEMEGLPAPPQRTGDEASSESDEGPGTEGDDMDVNALIDDIRRESEAMRDG